MKSISHLQLDQFTLRLFHHSVCGIGFYFWYWFLTIVLVVFVVFFSVKNTNFSQQKLVSFISCFHPFYLFIICFSFCRYLFGRWRFDSVRSFIWDYYYDQTQRANGWAQAERNFCTKSTIKSKPNTKLSNKSDFLMLNTLFETCGKQRTPSVTRSRWNCLVCIFDITNFFFFLVMLKVSVKACKRHTFIPNVGAW